VPADHHRLLGLTHTRYDGHHVVHVDTAEGVEVDAVDTASFETALDPVRGRDAAIVLGVACLEILQPLHRGVDLGLSDLGDDICDQRVVVDALTQVRRHRAIVRSRQRARRSDRPEEHAGDV